MIWIYVIKNLDGSLTTKKSNIELETIPEGEIIYKGELSEIDWLGEKMTAEFKDKSPGSTGLSHENFYNLVGEVDMKDSKKNWTKAILYEHSGNLYARDKSDFLNKFKINRDA